MNEIKCRAWDTVNQEMIAWELILEDGFEKYYYDETIILEQYTGTKDKDGKDLDWWEGDILRSDHFVNSRGKMHYLYHIIEWSDKYASWMAVNAVSKDEDNHDGNVQLWVYLKVALNPTKVGNIHDNPELLHMKGE